jgi:hypothetical protein
MMFIIRAEPGRVPDLPVKMTRRTPPVVPDGAERIDHFCLGDPEGAQAAGWTVVPVHDGWYADDAGGGVAVWGQGTYWEVRDTPLHVKEACGPAGAAGFAEAEEAPNVRAVIFNG